MSNQTDKQTDEFVLPYSDAPTIIRANQKDSYFMNVLALKVHEALSVLFGRHYAVTHQQESSVLSRAIYLGLTTLLGARTLGEEYCDLIYLSKNRSLPKTLRRLGYVLSYAVLPYALKRVASAVKSRSPRLASSAIGRFLFHSSVPKVAAAFRNLHLAVFYFFGSYYEFSKRIFGLRYTFGHSSGQQTANSGYEALGVLIVLQTVFSAIQSVRQAIKGTSAEPAESSEEKTDDSQTVRGVPAVARGHELLGTKPKPAVSLSDRRALKFIPEESRKCTLCLEYMADPTASLCGHVFCWTCICEWVKERPECPLCRQTTREENLLPLRQ